MSQHEQKSQGSQEEIGEKRRHNGNVALQTQFDALKSPYEGIIDFPLDLSLDSCADLLLNVKSDNELADLMMQLQQSYGNTYVQRVVEHIQSEQDLSPSPMLDTETASSRSQSTSVRTVTFDDGLGISLDIVATLEGEGEGEGAEPGEGESATTQQSAPIELPISLIPGGEDAIRPGVVNTRQQTSRGASVPSNAFGICRPFLSRIIGTTPHRRLGGLLGTTYEVRATADVRYRWDVQSLGRTNIAGADSPGVTADSWSQVVHDLTPSTAAIPRSPRREHWCEDLTARHEQYHARDFTMAFNLFSTLATLWLSRQSASSVTDATNKGDEAINQLVVMVNGYMGRGSSAPCESRAYGDGVPLYRARAQAVRARATREGWDPGMIIQ